MKRSVFKGMALGVALAASALCVQAQETVASVYTPQEDSVWVSYPTPRKYDKRVHRYRRAWEALTPTHTKIQMYGGMGLVSLGTGWDYGKRGQWETDVLLGIIPRYSSQCAKVTLTLKQNYIPWSVSLGKDFSLEPLATGLYFNTVFSGEFWTREPDRYPKRYYGFSTRLRTHIFLGQRIRFDVPDSYRMFSKSITFFYEVSSCDLYIVSAITNHLKPRDYLRLSFGLKFQIF
ncbi:MAG: hypothetical protein LUB83_04250 [Prevotellaceae bacterium]|nr:hypothetical protein [Prevotellaceae bacterium]